MGRELIVTVVGARSAGHLALDDETLIGHITADLARRYGSPGAGGLVLVTEDGSVLQSWMSLRQGQVSHGDKLTLRTVAAAFAARPASRRPPRLRFWFT